MKRLLCLRTMCLLGTTAVYAEKYPVGPEIGFFVSGNQNIKVLVKDQVVELKVPEKLEL